MVEDYLACTHFAACIPSHVELNLMRTRDLSIPSFLYISINLRAFAICPSLSNDNLKTCNKTSLQHGE